VSVPVVSVVMPVRDEERYVGAAVRSIFEQTLGDLELIVVDDGSTDDTSDVLAALAQDDPRLIVVRREGEGIVAALNAGVAHARGRYLARMDGDDISMPARLERQVEELDSRPRLGVLGTRVRYIDGEGKAIGSWDVPVGAALVRWSLAFGTPLAHPSVVIRRDLLAAAPYTDAAPHAEDYDLWVRLAALGELDNLRATLLERRVHGESVSDRHPELQRDAAGEVQQRAIAVLLGEPPDERELRALQRPSSVGDLLAAARLIRRLYAAAGGGREIRSDALRRLRGIARQALGPT
jgi:glycosyltransferase involved in cell wall biosynthesis